MDKPPTPPPRRYAAGQASPAVAQGEDGHRVAWEAQPAVQLSGSKPPLSPGAGKAPLPAAKMESIKGRIKQHKAAGTIAAPAVRLVPAAPAPESAGASLYDMEDDDWLSVAGAQFSPPGPQEARSPRAPALVPGSDSGSDSGDAGITQAVPPPPTSPTASPSTVPPSRSSSAGENSPRVMALRTRSGQERELKESALQELEAERAKRRELEEQLAQLQLMIAAADPQVPAPQTPPQPHGASGDAARERQRRNSLGLARGVPTDPSARRGSLGAQRSPEEDVDKPWRAAENFWINSLRQHEPITNLSRPPPAEVSASLLEALPSKQRRGSRGSGAGIAERRRSQSSAAGREQPSSARRRLHSADAVSAGAAGSSAGKWQRMVNLPVEEMMAIRERMGKLERTLNRLHGVDANGWDGTLAQAEARLRAAARRVIIASEEEGANSAAEQVKAEQEFDAWSKVITSHPAYIRREKTQRKEWDSQNFDKCQSALWLLRPLIPPDISSSSLERVMLHPALQLARPDPGGDSANALSTVNVPLAERIWRRRVLWLLRATPAEVANLHSSDLAGPFNAQGLDLMELRAVYAMLPPKFVNDKDGRKAAWREQLRERLVELTEKEARGTLEPDEERHPAYMSSGRGARAVSAPPLRDSANDASTVQDAEEDGVVVIAGKRVPFATARFGARRAAFPSALPTIVASPRRADADLRNSDALRGAVAVVVRGGCSFCEKAARVQAAGAIAIVFVNTDDELFSVAPGDDEEELAQTILLPIVLVRQCDAAALLAPTASIASRPTVVIRYERPDDSDSSDFDDDTDEEEHRWSDGAEEPGTVPPPRVEDLLQEVKLAAAKRRPRRTRSPQ